MNEKHGQDGHRGKNKYFHSLRPMEGCIDFFSVYFSTLQIDKKIQFRRTTWQMGRLCVTSDKQVICSTCEYSRSSLFTVFVFAVLTIRGLKNRE